MDYIVDTERVELVLDAILDRYRLSGYPYSRKRSMLVNLKLPSLLERGGEAEARWWFFCCYLMRGGINTDTALAALSRMYDREMQDDSQDARMPFIPERAAILTAEEMSGLLQEAGTGLYRLANDWITGAATMQERYGGQVLNLLADVHDYESAVEILHNQGKSGFSGFRYKMVSMFLFFVTEAGLLEYFSYPPPVDIHLQRVAIETGMIRCDDGSETFAYTAGQHDKLQSTLRNLYLEYMNKRGVLSNELSDAVWLLSRMLCRFNPGNMVSAPKQRDGRKTVLTFHQADFSTLRDQRKYARSCARCPVEHLCEWNVPAQPYYIQGRVGTSGPRLRSPILSFDFDS